MAPAQQTATAVAGPLDTGLGTRLGFIERPTAGPASRDHSRETDLGVWLGDTGRGSPFIRTNSMRAIKCLLRLAMKIFSAYRAWEWIRDAIDGL